MASYRGRPLFAHAPKIPRFVYFRNLSGLRDAIGLNQHITVYWRDCQFFSELFSKFNLRSGRASDVSKDDQERAMRAILEGNDVFMLLPTAASLLKWFTLS